MPATTVVFRGAAKFTVTVLLVAVADVIATGLGLKTAGAETVPDTDAAVRPPKESTPTTLYVMVCEPLTGGDVIAGAEGVNCAVAAPAFQIQTPAPFIKYGRALPTVMLGWPPVVLTVVVAPIKELGLCRNDCLKLTG